MAEDRRLTTASKGERSVGHYGGRDSQPPQVVNPDRELVEHFTYTTSDFYIANGKRMPSARIVQAWAKEAGLSSEVVECGKDEKRAWAHVRAWVGPKNNPTLVREKYVIHLFSQLFTTSVFEAISNGLMVPGGQTYESGRPKMTRVYPEWEIGPDNTPVLTDRQCQFQILKNLLEKTRFAERDAISKAERAAFLELLGKDDEDNDEETTVPKERSPEPKTLEDYRRVISSTLKKQAGNDLAKASAALLAISEVIGEYVAVKSTLDIAQIDHAKEIYRRLQVGQTAAKMAEELNDTLPDFDEPGDDSPAAA